MSQAKKTAAIVNPQSGGGKTARQWPRIHRELERRLGPVTARFTERQGHGIALARELLEQGFELILAAGGDGTLNEVANGFLKNDELLRPDACLGILPLGTGGDFRRTLGISAKLEEAVEVLATRVPLRIDVGKATFPQPAGTRQSRYFINVVSFGMGGEVAARSRNFLTPFGGKLAFEWATVRVFLGYRGKSVRLTLDGAQGSSRFFITNIAVGNGRFHGGGMHPCPKAVLNDGVLEVTVIDYLGIITFLGVLPILYSDDIYRHPKAHHLRARHILAEATEPTRFELDGEPLGRLPLEIEVLPERIPVLVPSASPLLGA